MIGIKSIGVYIPENKIDNIIQAENFDEPPSFIKNKIGAFHLPSLTDGEETSDLAVNAVNNLLENSPLKKEQIEVIIVVTQNGDFNGLPHTSAIVQSKLSLSTNISAFDISLGCSGYVYGLSIIKSHMQEMGFKNGILITSDPYSKIIDKGNRVTSLLFGDAATATWLGEEPVFSIDRPKLQTDGSGYESLVKREYLEMNGRQVFNFAAVNVPKQVKEYLDDKHLLIDNVDLFLLHQGSKAIVDVITRRLGADKCKVPFDIVNTGNTVSSSIPLLLSKELNNKNVNKLIISGFGVGLSWATNLLERVKC